VLRDSYGVRPLCIGVCGMGNNYCISSESYALLKYKFKRNVKPGEVIHINKNIVKTTSLYSRNITANCLFEYIYFLNNKSESVVDVRGKFGKILALKESIIKELTGEIVVCGVPSSGIISAERYAKELNLPYSQFITKNINSNRTFILKNDEERDKASKKKYIITDPHLLNNKNLIIFDDSIVRGITMKNLIKQLWEYKPKTIHIRISAPPIKHPCYYGVDIPDKKALIAYDKTEKDISEILNVDSLKYIEIDDLYIIFPKDKTCYGCFNLNYNNDW